MAALKTISLAEVAQHTTPDSCWIVMDGKVLDVTKFLSEHPGGEEVITEMAGKDATDAFRDVGHSKDAQEMVKDYIIGQLPEGDTPAASATPTPAAAVPAKAAAAGSFTDIFTSSTWTNFLIPTAIGVVVYMGYKGAVKVLA